MNPDLKFTSFNRAKHSCLLLKLIGLPIILLILWVQSHTSGWEQTEKVTAFVHVNLVPMTAETISSDQTVLVKGSQIISVGPSNAADVPDNSTVIDGSNFYLMPGLADMHTHTDTRWLNGDWPVSPFDLFLANGVTTIRDFGPTGAPPDYALRWRDGGRVYSTGYVRNMQSHTVPGGVLKEGQTYRWRVRITDSDNWVNVQNRSHSEWQIFHLK